MRGRSGRARRLSIVARFGAAAAALLSAGLPATPAATLGAPSVPPARIEPALLSQLEQGPAVGIMSWDQTGVSRGKVKEYLARSGMQAKVFSDVPVAYACAASPADALALARAPGARSVVANQAVTPALDKSVPTAFNGDPKAVWQGMAVTGKNVTIAVLDTGVDGRHADVRFGSRMKTNVRVMYSNKDALGGVNDFCQMDRYSDEFVGMMENTDLGSGHGTVMASVAAGDGTASGGQYRGVAPQAEIAGISVVDVVSPRIDLMPDCAARGAMSWDEANSCMYQPSTLGIIGGINFVLTRLALADPPAKVILGGWTLDGLYDPWHPLAEAIRSATGNGVNFVVPAGNGGPDTSDCTGISTCHYNPMGGEPTMISVAAGAKTSRTKLEAYSSRGDPAARTYHGETFRYQPTLTAPGTGVVSARATLATSPYAGSPIYNRLGAGGNQGNERVDPNYVAITGTSVAAAHVAGAIALMQQAAFDASGYYLTTDEVKTILEVTATPMNGYQRWEVGAGMIDVTRAVEYARWW